MSGPGRPSLLNRDQSVYREVWIIPVGWDGKDSEYPLKLEWVLEDDSGWHGWAEWLWLDEVPEVTWLKNYWQEVPCPFNS